MSRRIFSFLLTLTFLISAPKVQADLLHDISTTYSINVAPNVNLRVTYTAAKAPTKKVVIFLPGRASFFEKNKGLILGVTGHSYEGTNNVELPNQADFWCIDMRAHGASGGRLGANDQRGHIDSFDTYLSDIHTVITDKIAPAYEGQNVEFYIMGSSLGGHLALRYLQDYANQSAITFKRALLIVPMVEFMTKPWPRPVAKGLVTSACAISFSKKYALGYGDLDLSKSDFTRFKGHHSRTAFDETNAMMAKNPELITGGPTFGWLKAAFDSEGPLQERSLPQGVEIISYVAGDDTVVDANATLAFCKRHDAKVYFYAKSRHNILKETKEFSGTFWQDLDLK